MKHLSHRSLSTLSLRVVITTLLAIFTLCAQSLNAQGTFVYDQESSNDEVSFFGGAEIQFYGSVGQSFTPTLSNVGFVRLRYFDVNPGNALGATLIVRLHSGAINGTVIGSSDPVPLPDGFVGTANFLFSTPVPVNPNTTYFFETSVQTGDSWGINALSASQGDANYPGGTLYGGLTAFSGNDLWFREGIVVPEPSSIALFVGSGTFLWFLRRKNQR